MLLAIDPGAIAGWAIFDEDGHLVACGVVKHDEAGLDDIPAQVVIEKPRIYPGAKKQARDADIITLAVKAGEWGGRYWEKCPVRYVEPAEWKGGSVPKEIHQPRIRARLGPEEVEVLAQAEKKMAAGKVNNMVDAVGIGLFAVGRRA